MTVRAEIMTERVANGSGVQVAQRADRTVHDTPVPGLEALEAPSRRRVYTVIESYLQYHRGEPV